MNSSKRTRRTLSEKLDMLAAGYPLEMIDPSLVAPYKLPDDLDDNPYLSFDDYLDREEIKLNGFMAENVTPGSVTECLRALEALIAQNETLREFPMSRPSLRPSDIRGITPELVTVFTLLFGPVAKPIWRVLAWVMVLPPNPEEAFSGRARRGRPADISRKVIVWFYDGRELQEGRPKAAVHGLAKRVEKIFGLEKSFSLQNIRTWRKQPGYDNSVRAIYSLLNELFGDERKLAQILSERLA